MTHAQTIKKMKTVFTKTVNTYADYSKYQAIAKDVCNTEEKLDNYFEFMYVLNSVALEKGIDITLQKQ